MKYISKDPPETVFVSIPYFPARMLLSNSHRRGTRCLYDEDEFDDHLDGENNFDDDRDQPINSVPIRPASISLCYECHLKAGQRRPGPKALIVKTPWKDWDWDSIIPLFTVS